MFLCIPKSDFDGVKKRKDMVQRRVYGSDDCNGVLRIGTIGCVEVEGSMQCSKNRMHRVEEREWLGRAREHARERDDTRRESKCKAPCNVLKIGCERVKERVRLGRAREHASERDVYGVVDTYVVVVVTAEMYMINGDQSVTRTRNSKRLTLRPATRLNRCKPNSTSPN
jgi:hypothetical protein